MRMRRDSSKAVRARTVRVLRQGSLHGLLAGAVGVGVMTLSEKAEQALTGRPSSQVPGRTFLRLPAVRGRRRSMNPAMHVGQGVALGVLRGVMADSGLRGGWSSAMFTVARLINDQTLENATGTGAPPWTWPRRELLVDLAHKSVYAFATGVVADWLAARQGVGPGERHARLYPGRREHVGPV